MEQREQNRIYCQGDPSHVFLGKGGSENHPFMGTAKICITKYLVIECDLI